MTPPVMPGADGRMGQHDDAELRRWATLLHRLVPGPANSYLRASQVQDGLAGLQLFAVAVVARLRKGTSDSHDHEFLDALQGAFTALAGEVLWRDQADEALSAARLAAALPQHHGFPEAHAVWATRLATAAHAHGRALTVLWLDVPPEAYQPVEFLAAEARISKDFTALEALLRPIPVDRLPRAMRLQTFRAMDAAVRGRGEGGTDGEILRMGHLASSVDAMAQRLYGRPAAAAARLWRAVDGHCRRLHAWRMSTAPADQRDLHPALLKASPLQVEVHEAGQGSLFEEVEEADEASADQEGARRSPHRADAWWADGLPASEQQVRDLLRWPADAEHLFPVTSADRELPGEGADGLAASLRRLGLEGLADAPLALTSGRSLMVVPIWGGWAIMTTRHFAAIAHPNAGPHLNAALRNGLPAMTWADPLSPDRQAVLEAAETLESQLRDEHGDPFPWASLAAAEIAATWRSADGHGLAAAVRLSVDARRVAAAPATAAADTREPTPTAPPSVGRDRAGGTTREIEEVARGLGLEVTRERLGRSGDTLVTVATASQTVLNYSDLNGAIEFPGGRLKRQSVPAFLRAAAAYPHLPASVLYDIAAVGGQSDPDAPPRLRELRALAEEHGLQVAVEQVSGSTFIALHEPDTPHPAVVTFRAGEGTAHHGPTSIPISAIGAYLREYRRTGRPLAVHPKMFRDVAKLPDGRRRLAQLTPHLVHGGHHLREVATAVRSAMVAAGRGQLELAAIRMAEAEAAAPPLTPTGARNCLLVDAVFESAFMARDADDVALAVSDGRHLDASARELDWMRQLIRDEPIVLQIASSPPAAAGHADEEARSRLQSLLAQAAAAHERGDGETAVDFLDQALLAAPHRADEFGELRAKFTRLPQGATRGDGGSGDPGASVVDRDVPAEHLGDWLTGLRDHPWAADLERLGDHARRHAELADEARAHPENAFAGAVLKAWVAEQAPRLLGPKSPCAGLLFGSAGEGDDQHFRRRAMKGLARMAYRHHRDRGSISEVTSRRLEELRWRYPQEHQLRERPDWEGLRLAVEVDLYLDRIGVRAEAHEVDLDRHGRICVHVQGAGLDCTLQIPDRANAPFLLHRDGVRGPVPLRGGLYRGSADAGRIVEHWLGQVSMPGGATPAGVDFVALGGLLLDDGGLSRATDSEMATPGASRLHRFRVAAYALRVLSKRYPAAGEDDAQAAEMMPALKRAITAVDELERAAREVAPEGTAFIRATLLGADVPDRSGDVPPGREPAVAQAASQSARAGAAGRDRPRPAQGMADLEQRRTAQRRWQAEHGANDDDHRHASMHANFEAVRRAGDCASDGGPRDWKAVYADNGLGSVVYSPSRDRVATAEQDGVDGYVPLLRPDGRTWAGTRATGPPPAPASAAPPPPAFIFTADGRGGYTVAVKAPGESGKAATPAGGTVVYGRVYKSGAGRTARWRWELPNGIDSGEGSWNTRQAAAEALAVRRVLYRPDGSDDSVSIDPPEGFDVAPLNGLQRGSTSTVLVYPVAVRSVRGQTVVDRWSAPIAVHTCLVLGPGTRQGMRQLLYRDRFGAEGHVLLGEESTGGLVAVSPDPLPAPPPVPAVLERTLSGRDDVVAAVHAYDSLPEEHPGRQAGVRGKIVNAARSADAADLLPVEWRVSDLVSALGSAEAGRPVRYAEHRIWRRYDRPAPAVWEIADHPDGQYTDCAALARYLVAAEDEELRKRSAEPADRPQTLTASSGPGTPESPYLEALHNAGMPREWRTTVRVSARRALGFTVEPGGEVVIRVPSGLAPQDAAAQMVTVLPRLRDSVERSIRAAPNLAVKSISEGETFTFLGTEASVKLTDARDAAPARLLSEPDGDRVELREDQAGEASALIGLYQRIGADWVARNHRQAADRLTVAARTAQMPAYDVTVAELRGNRWGQAKPAAGGGAPAQVTLHWAIFQFPPRLTEYVLIHEMAHLLVTERQDHGPRWRALMSRVMPDWKDRRDELARLGARSWLGDTAAPKTRSGQAPSRQRDQALTDGAGTGSAGKRSGPEPAPPPDRPHLDAPAEAAAPTAPFGRGPASTTPPEPTPPEPVPDGTVPDVSSGGAATVPTLSERITASSRQVESLLGAPKGSGREVVHATGVDADRSRAAVVSHASLLFERITQDFQDHAAGDSLDRPAEETSRPRAEDAPLPAHLSTSETGPERAVIDALREVITQASQPAVEWRDQQLAMLRLRSAAEAVTPGGWSADTCDLAKAVADAAHTNAGALSPSPQALLVGHPPVKTYADATDLRQGEADVAAAVSELRSAAADQEVGEWGHGRLAAIERALQATISHRDDGGVSGQATRHGTLAQLAIELADHLVRHPRLGGAAAAAYRVWGQAARHQARLRETLDRKGAWARTMLADSARAASARTAPPNDDNERASTPWIENTAEHTVLHADKRDELIKKYATWPWKKRTAQACWDLKPEKEVGRLPYLRGLAKTLAFAGRNFVIAEASPSNAASPSKRAARPYATPGPAAPAPQQPTATTIKLPPAPEPTPRSASGQPAPSSPGGSAAGASAPGARSARATIPAGVAAAADSEVDATVQARQQASAASRLVNAARQLKLGGDRDRSTTAGLIGSIHAELVNDLQQRADRAAADLTHLSEQDFGPAGADADRDDLAEVGRLLTDRATEQGAGPAGEVIVQMAMAEATLPSRGSSSEWVWLYRKASNPAIWHAHDLREQADEDLTLLAARRVAHADDPGIQRSFDRIEELINQLLEAHRSEHPAEYDTTPLPAAAVRNLDQLRDRLLTLAVHPHGTSGTDARKTRLHLRSVCDDQTLILSPGGLLFAHRQQFANGRRSEWSFTPATTGAFLIHHDHAEPRLRPALTDQTAARRLLTRLETDLIGADGRPFPWTDSDVRNVDSRMRQWRSNRGETLAQAVARLQEEVNTAATPAPQSRPEEVDTADPGTEDRAQERTAEPRAPARAAQQDASEPDQSKTASSVSAGEARATTARPHPHATPLELFEQVDHRHGAAVPDADATVPGDPTGQENAHLSAVRRLRDACVDRGTESALGRVRQIADELAQEMGAGPDQPEARRFPSAPHRTRDDLQALAAVSEQLRQRVAAREGPVAQAITELLIQNVTSPADFSVDVLWLLRYADWHAHELTDQAAKINAKLNDLDKASTADQVTGAAAARWRELCERLLAAHRTERPAEYDPRPFPARPVANLGELRERLRALSLHPDTVAGRYNWRDRTNLQHLAEDPTLQLSPGGLFFAHRQKFANGRSAEWTVSSASTGDRLLDLGGPPQLRPQITDVGQAHAFMARLETELLGVDQSILDWTGDDLRAVRARLESWRSDRGETLRQAIGRLHSGSAATPTRRKERDVTAAPRADGAAAAKPAAARPVTSVSQPHGDDPGRDAAEGVDLVAVQTALSGSVLAEGEPRPREPQKSSGAPTIRVEKVRAGGHLAFNPLDVLPAGHPALADMPRTAAGPVPWAPSLGSMLVDGRVTSIDREAETGAYTLVLSEPMWMDSTGKKVGLVPTDGIDALGRPALTLRGVEGTRRGTGGVLYPPQQGNYLVAVPGSPHRYVVRLENQIGGLSVAARDGTKIGFVIEPARPPIAHLVGEKPAAVDGVNDWYDALVAMLQRAQGRAQRQERRSTDYGPAPKVGKGERGDVRVAGPATLPPAVSAPDGEQAEASIHPRTSSPSSGSQSHRPAPQPLRRPQAQGPADQPPLELPAVAVREGVAAAADRRAAGIGDAETTEAGLPGTGAPEVTAPPPLTPGPSGSDHVSPTTAVAAPQKGHGNPPPHHSAGPSVETHEALAIPGQGTSTSQPPAEQGALAPARSGEADRSSPTAPAPQSRGEARQAHRVPTPPAAANGQDLALALAVDVPRLLRWMRSEQAPPSRYSVLGWRYRGQPDAGASYKKDITSSGLEIEIKGPGANRQGKFSWAQIRNWLKPAVTPLRQQIILEADRASTMLNFETFIAAFCAVGEDHLRERAVSELDAIRDHEVKVLLDDAVRLNPDGHPRRTPASAPPNEPGTLFQADTGSSDDAESALLDRVRQLAAALPDHRPEGRAATHADIAPGAVLTYRDRGTPGSLDCAFIVTAAPAVEQDKLVLSGEIAHRNGARTPHTRRLHHTGPRTFVRLVQPPAASLRDLTLDSLPLADADIATALAYLPTRAAAHLLNAAVRQEVIPELRAEIERRTPERARWWRVAMPRGPAADALRGDVWFGPDGMRSVVVGSRIRRAGTVPWDALVDWLGCGVTPQLTDASTVIRHGMAVLAELGPDRGAGERLLSLTGDVKAFTQAAMATLLANVIDQRGLSGHAAPPLTEPPTATALTGLQQALATSLSRQGIPADAALPDQPGPRPRPLSAGAGGRHPPPKARAPEPASDGSPTLAADQGPPHSAGVSEPSSRPSISAPVTAQSRRPGKTVQTPSERQRSKVDDTRHGLAAALAAWSGSDAAALLAAEDAELLEITGSANTGEPGTVLAAAGRIAHRRDADLSHGDVAEAARSVLRLLSGRADIQSRDLDLLHRIIDRSDSEPHPRVADDQRSLTPPSEPPAPTLQLRPGQGGQRSDAAPPDTEPGAPASGPGPQQEAAASPPTVEDGPRGGKAGITEPAPATTTPWADSGATGTLDDPTADAAPTTDRRPLALPKDGQTTTPHGPRPELHAARTDTGSVGPAESSSAGDRAFAFRFVPAGTLSPRRSGVHTQHLADRPLPAADLIPPVPKAAFQGAGQPRPPMNSSPVRRDMSAGEPLPAETPASRLIRALRMIVEVVLALAKRLQSGRQRERDSPAPVPTRTTALPDAIGATPAPEPVQEPVAVAEPQDPEPVTGELAHRNHTALSPPASQRRIRPTPAAATTAGAAGSAQYDFPQCPVTTRQPPTPPAHRREGAPDKGAVHGPPATPTRRAHSSA